ncbi:MAG: F0F1 ATP synthase subunit B [Marinosulfonomonas sp.]|nr:F0F1 ATP synthase subunit B [Marinosulfonomonas sp.]
MSVDWITVIAQIANLLVLIWLLKRFLYRPILDGIDAREAEIADRMTAATQAREQAENVEAGYHEQVEIFRAGESAMTDTTRQQAEVEREALLADAQVRIDTERKDWTTHLQHEEQKYMSELHRVGGKALLSLTRKALGDLSDETLEERVVAHIDTKFIPMAQELRHEAGEGAEIIASTRDPLSKTAQDKLLVKLQQIVPGLKLIFDTDANQSPGLILRMGGAEVAWTLDTYIEGLDTLLQEHLASESGMNVGADNGH